MASYMAAATISPGSAGTGDPGHSGDPGHGDDADHGGDAAGMAAA